MTRDITGADSEHLLDDGWSTPLEAGVRGTIRGFIETLLEEELEAALGRARYARLRHAAVEQEATARGLGNEEPAAGSVPSAGHRHGRRERQVMGSFGTLEVAVPRACLDTADGRTTEWANKTLPAYRRRTREVDALIAGAYLGGTNTRRVGRALAAVFRGVISKSTVSRVWRKIKADWESWNRRDLASENIVRLILDGTVVKVRLDRKATAISLLVVLGVRRDGQKVLLAVKNMGGGMLVARRERGSLARRSRRPDTARPQDARARHRRRRARIGEGAHLAVARSAPAALHGAQAQEPDRARTETARRGDCGRLCRHYLCGQSTGRREAAQGLHPQMARQVRSRRHQPGESRRPALHVHAAARRTMEVGAHHQRHRASASGVQAAHQDADRATSAETAAMLFWALLASGQIVLRKVDGWTTIARPFAEPIDLAA
jgi:hypothetical protein